MSRTISLAGRNIGPGYPCFIIAEGGVNHNGELELALRLVDVAAEAGADAVKFQAFHTERLTTMAARKATYQRDNTGTDESQFEMLKGLELAPEDFARIRQRCQQRGIAFLCTPFDSQSADELERVGLPAFKVPSGEVTNLPYLQFLAAKGKPLIVSTGMATMDEVADAVEAIRAAGCSELALLQCVTSYPADPALVNLRAMASMSDAFGVPTGYSDHTAGLEISLAAAALGACIIEKHFTLDRALPGPDHKASLEPNELVSLVQGIRRIEAALGDGRKKPAGVELEIRPQVRRSLVLTCAVPEGRQIEAPMLDALRPGTGIPPSLTKRVVGRRARRALEAGVVLSWEDLT